MNEKYLDTFLYWTKERDAILTRKQNGETVLTEDPILQRYSFCNVRREDDRGTIYNREKIRAYSKHPEYLLLATLARMCNEPATLDYLIDAGIIGSIRIDIDLVQTKIEQAKENGVKVMRSSYNNGKPAIKGLSHAAYYRNVLKELRTLLPKWNQAIYDKNIDGLWEVLTTPAGFASFLPNQILMDIAHTETMSWSDYKDTMTHIGPGSKRGMEKIYGESKNFISNINELKQIVSKELDMELSAHDIQNCLCEFDKYTRIEGGTKSSLKIYGEK